MSTVSTQFRLKRRTAAQWATAATLAQGEPGFESDTGRLKIGTGSASWAALPYVSNVRTNTAGGWLGSSLILGNGEIGYESDTGRMKVGNGTAGWNALNYISPFTLTNITPLLGVPGTNAGSASSTGWYRRLIPPANKIDQVEFYPGNVRFDPSGTATTAGEVRVYTSTGVDNVSALQTSSYPISMADWNEAAAAGTSLKVTLQTPFTPNGNAGYVIGSSALAGYGLDPTTTITLNNVSISASVGGTSTITWGSVTGSLTSPVTSFDRRVLYGTGVLSGTYLNYTGGLTGTITNLNYPTAVLNIPTVRVYNLNVPAILTGVTISATVGGLTNFSWTGSSTSNPSGTVINQGHVLAHRNALNGSLILTASSTVTPGSSGSGTIQTFNAYPTAVTIPSVDVITANAGYRRMTENIGVVVSSASTFIVNSNVSIAGAGTNNGTFVIKSINTSTNTLFLSNANGVTFIGSGATATPPGGSAVTISSIYTPGTIKITLASSITGIAVGNNVTIAGTSGNNVIGYPVTSFDTATNSFTIINLNGVSQAAVGTATINSVNSGSAVNISSITPLALMDNDPTRYFSYNTYGTAPVVTFSTPRVFNNSPFINLYTTDTASSGGSGVDSVSTATVTSALGQVSTVTSNNAVARINGNCDILLPRKLRLLKRQGEEFNIYNKHLITGNWVTTGVVDYSISPTTPEYGEQLNECVRFTGNELVTGAPLLTLTSTVRDYNWNTAKTTSSLVNVADMTLSGAVRYLSIGDSITRRCQYQQQAMGLGYISSPISSIGVTGSTGSYTVTVTVTSTGGFKVGDSVSIVGATAATNDVTVSIATIASSTQFTFIRTTGTPVAQGGAGGRAVVGAVAASRVTNCELASGILTVTVGSNSGFAVGDSVTLFGISTRNNISARIDELVSTTGFTIKHEGGENSASVGSAITSKINTVGTRYDVYNTPLASSFSASGTGYAIEGRGGWAVSTYISNGGSLGGFDSPFMFPTTLSGALYRGNTEFWKRAIAVDSGGTCIVTVVDRTGIIAGETSITISGATSGNNITKTVVSLIGTNSFTIRNDSAVTQTTGGTVNGGSATTNIQSITPISLYDYQGFGRAAREGSASTYAYDTSGYPTSPTIGWIVNDPSKSNKFQRWSGSTWADDATANTWEFSYQKYLDRYAWAFPSGNPTHVSILLAANDFNANEGADPIDFSSWIANYKIIVDSIRAVTGTKVIVLLPTMASSQDGYGSLYNLGVLAERARRNFQTASRALIDGFDTDTYEGQNVYVALFGAGTDPIYGPALTGLTAPNKYITDSTLFIRRSTDGIHPAISAMYQSGDWLAAMLQNIR